MHVEGLPTQSLQVVEESWAGLIVDIEMLREGKSNKGNPHNQKKPYSSSSFKEAPISILGSHFSENWKMLRLSSRQSQERKIYQTRTQSIPVRINRT